MKFEKILIISVCSTLLSCKQFYFEPTFKSKDDFKASVHLEKLFFVLQNEIFNEQKIEEVKIEKIFIQGIQHKNHSFDNSNSLYRDFHNLSLSSDLVSDFDNKLKKSLGRSVKSVDFTSDLEWTNMVLPRNYAFKNFDPEVVNLNELLRLMKLNSNEVVILPLISYYKDYKLRYYYRFSEITKLSLAIYIFDKNQIYYARSVGLSKTNFIENSINPKDTEFQQSEWDYLVYEALRPLLEKGVELEIRSPLTPREGID